MLCLRRLAAHCGSTAVIVKVIEMAIFTAHCPPLTSITFKPKARYSILVEQRGRETLSLNQNNTAKQLSFSFPLIYTHAIYHRNLALHSNVLLL